MPPRHAPFGSEWLQGKLATLLPDLPHAHLCVALSGGVDSSVLLAALAEGKQTRRHLRAIHIEHGLHPDAPRWSAHCSALAKKLDVPLEIHRIRVTRPRGTSLEENARRARYALLESLLQQDEVLLTAHHGDDQFETVLLQLLRGAGLPGLAAMADIAPFGPGWLVRPLLSRTRAEIESWARAHDLGWVEDETNTDERFDRNYLRRRVLPLLRERWPGAAAAVARSARHAAEAQRLLEALARADVEAASDGPALSVKTLRKLDADRRRNALRFWIARSGWPLPDARRLEELAGPVFEARADANPQVIWNGVIAQRHTDLLTLRAAPKSASAEEAPGAEVEWQWRESPVLSIGSAGSLEVRRDPHGPLDLGLLPAQLAIRWRRGGERLRPRRGGPSRTLKSLLQEARVPVAERQRIPLVYAGERLIAVADLWLDASVQAGAETTQRARLYWRR